MKGIKYIIPLILTVFFSQQNYSQNITIDENYTAQQLIQDVLINSPCATVSNFSVSGGDFGTGQKSYAFFDGNSSIFPFQNGVVLSTGKASNTVGPNNTLSDDNGVNWTGDSDLQQALSISNTLNATVLEFDFTTIGSKFSFDYIFASEEYQGTAPCTYSDGFAFLLKPVGSSTYQNLALIPNTNTPVLVTTVHPQIGNSCGAQNEQYFGGYNNSNYPINFNGQTVILKAEATVLPNTLYHIKLVIADEGNYRYDSAIFIGGGSFNFGLDLGNDRLIADGNPLCNNETLVLDAIQNGTNTYQWFKNNVLLAGEINSTYTVVNAGTYKVEVNINGLCISDGDIDIEYAPVLIQNQTVFNKCDTDGTIDGKTNFDLNTIKSQLFTNLPASYQVGLYDSMTSGNQLPANYTNTTPNSQTIYARVINVPCYSDFPIQLNVTSLDLGTDENVGICNGTLTSISVPSGFATYNWNTNPVQNTASITVNTSGTYTVTATNLNGCNDTKSFFVTASEPATITGITINDFSENNSAIIQVSGNGDYEFSLNGFNYQDSNTFTNLQTGNYSFFIKDTKGCGITPGTFQILAAPKYFTPNGDGLNEYWQVPLLALQPKTIITIFDRYGKLIYSFKANQNGWDGKFNGETLFADDYWYTIVFENGRIVKGHFSLIR
ncbi:choice-of-anchor L domain-containing protein [uncultured Flavobacterium sp.]|uniref:choice-of-anchor L domain-containing protein n=1 Tax=uncultured Flavobacterium sp. TaxID=165435 RepID=UPI0030ED9F68